MVEPLSPELALVDPELAERARAQLVEPPDLPTARADRTEPVEAKRRSRGKTTAIVAAIAVAAVLGGAGAIWARYDDSTSSAQDSAPPTAPPAVRSQSHTPTAPRSPLRPPRRQPDFHVAGAPKEPLDEITLPARARRLSTWLAPKRSLTDANLRHWLYQHAWIVTGAKFGWWHGAEAIRTLIRVDRRVEARWGIGYRSEAAARRALAEVETKAR